MMSYLEFTDQTIDNNAFIGHWESFLMHRSLIIEFYLPLAVARGAYFYRRDNCFAMKYFFRMYLPLALEA